jgi:hypothetical protein
MNIDLIYKDIIDRAKNNADYFTDNEFKPVAHFAWYHGQYEQQFTEENKTHPFIRPAMFIQFGDVQPERSQGTGFGARGRLPITLHVVQDLIVDGREGAASHDSFKKLLQYWKLIMDLYQGYRGDACAGAMVFAGWSPDHNNDNLMIDKISFEVDVVIKRTFTAPV